MGPKHLIGSLAMLQRVAAGSLTWTFCHECLYFYKHSYLSGSLIWEALSLPVFWLVVAMPTGVFLAAPPFALG